MKRSLIVDTSVHFIFHSVLVLSVYLLFAGHNQPGGGFAGGLVASAAVGLRYVAGGIESVRRASPVRAWTILGTGLLFSATTATLPVLRGRPVLDSAIAEWHLPVLGDVHVTTASLFDVGVYLVVVGLVLMVFEAFGDDVVTDAPGAPGAPGATGATGDGEPGEVPGEVGR
jgi:multicomponent Na+:H+ antiporter subunit A